MKVTLRAWILIALAAALTGLGSLINSWFYTFGGSAIFLYITWRYATFAAVRSELRIEVTRVSDKQALHLGSFVSFVVTVRSNLTVRGTYTEVLPECVSLIEGQTSKALSLAPRGEGTLRYTVQLTSRADLVLERAQFTPDNDLFLDAIEFKAYQTTLRQPSGAITIAHGSRGGSAGAGVQTASVSSLFHGLKTNTSIETAYLREYRFSDQAKLIDWKTSARRTEPLLLVRELLPEFEASGFGKGMPIYLIVDQTASMARGPLGESNLDFVVDLAGRLVKLGVQKGSPLSLVTYDEEMVTESRRSVSPADVTDIVDTLNSAAFESRRAHDKDVNLPSDWKPGITSMEVTKFKKSILVEDEDADDDIRRFREVVSYLYAHEEGYNEELERSTAFRAITTTVTRRARQSLVIIFSDLENDLDPLTEAIRVAARRGNTVHVVALFPNAFETFEDAVVNSDDLYTSYVKYRARINNIRQIKGVDVHEAAVSDLLEPKKLDSILKAL